ncbi:hypothetical protein N8772_00575 [Rickettsiales bacterium]|nr:hypothetical protein [Rickettsiales bacterium]
MDIGEPKLRSNYGGVWDSLTYKMPIKFPPVTIHAITLSQPPITTNTNLRYPFLQKTIVTSANSA